MLLGGLMGNGQNQQPIHNAVSHKMGSREHDELFEQARNHRVMGRHPLSGQHWVCENFKVQPSVLNVYLNITVRS